MKIKILSTALLLITILACEKKADPTLTSDSTDNKATVQLYNAALNTTRNYLYINNSPIIGTTMVTGGLYPASFRYAIAPGTQQMLIKDTLATSTQVPLSFSQMFDAKSDYTIFMYDSVTNVKQKTVKNDIVIPSDTTARLRVANFLYSAVTVPAVDFYSVKRAANIATNVAKTDVTAFIPYASALNDTIIVRSAGTTTALGQLNGINPTAKRSYTVLIRGSVAGSKLVSSFTNHW